MEATIQIPTKLSITLSRSPIWRPATQRETVMVGCSFLLRRRLQTNLSLRRTRIDPLPGQDARDADTRGQPACVGAVHEGDKPIPHGVRTRRLASPTPAQASVQPGTAIKTSFCHVRVQPVDVVEIHGVPAGWHAKARQHFFTMKSIFSRRRGDEARCTQETIEDSTPCSW